VPKVQKQRIREHWRDTAAKRPWWKRWGAAPPSWLTSAVLHAVVLIGLALWVAPSGDMIRPALDVLISDAALDAVQTISDQPSPREMTLARANLLADTDNELAMVVARQELNELDDAPPAPPQELAGIPEQLAEQLTTPVDTPNGGGLDGRSAALRGRMLEDGGGTRQSELAVRRGLRWLAAHQRNDGSWHFDHTLGGPCNGLCGNPGTSAATTGATGVALLAFLGAGETHRDGEYQETVRRGLYYLSGRMLETEHGGDLQEGTMYAHGLATIALCEAFAMTRDPDLEPVAQQAIDFIVYAQDQAGGGWRYFPGQPGDTTVTGWQWMALQSARMAYLVFPAQTVNDGLRFLDSVQSQHGALYGYQTPGEGRATTAIGLLCRMYGGWRRSHPALQQGVYQLYQWGPSEDDMYYNYYATQVLHHFGGGYWERWNERLREQLIATQARSGHEAGSWYYPGGQCEPGGRLLSTALATMTLEVYYRHLPLYREPALEDE
jgi:hypothetical protein